MKNEKKKKSTILFWVLAVVFAAGFVVSGLLLIRETRQTKQDAETFSELAALRAPRREATAEPKATPTATPGTVQIQIPQVGQPTGSEAPAATPAAQTGEEPAERPTASPAEDAPVEEAPTEDAPAETPLTGETPVEEAPTEAPAEETPAEEAPIERTPLEQYLPLYELNADFFGWLTIPDTRVDYPVMYNARNPLAYLGHDFYGRFSYAGVPYVDSDCDPDGNFYLVYGHKMKDGSMFADLVVYEDQAFWENHKTITFDTLYEERTYEVVMAIKARVLDKEEKDGFRYYYYTSLDTEDEFDEYIEQAKELACYDTGVDVSFGDELLVLSTCYHYTRNGRFVLIAKRIVD